MMPELEDINLTATGLLAAGSIFPIHFLKVKLFYQSGPFLVLFTIWKLIWLSSLQHSIMCAWTLPETPEFCRCPWLTFVSEFVPLTSSSAVHSHDWEGHQSSCVDTWLWVTQKYRVRFSCFVAPCRASEHSTRRCFAAVVQHRDWASNARELLFAAFPGEASRFNYLADFIQALEMLSSLWHSACFSSAVPPDGASSGEELSWKDVKEAQLNCATEEYVHWDKTKTDLKKKKITWDLGCCKSWCAFIAEGMHSITVAKTVWISNSRVQLSKSRV